MFKRIYLEISNICNVQCSFCPIVEKDKKIMGLDEFEDCLRQVAPLADIVCLHLLGEPLAHPKFAQILDICDQYHTQIDLTTNGLLIKKQQDIILNSNCVRQVNFSLQAFRDNFPDKELAPYLNPIFEFLKQGQLRRPELYTNFRLWNQTSDAADNEELFWAIENEFQIQINRNVEVGAIKSKNIWNRLYLHFDSRFEWPAMSLPIQGTQGRCNGTLKHIGIHADGTVVPCCLDEKAVINLGNIHEQTLLDILHGERFQAMRAGFMNGILVEDFCQRCSFINRFKSGKTIANPTPAQNIPTPITDHHTPYIC